MADVRKQSVSRGGGKSNYALVRVEATETTRKSINEPYILIHTNSSINNGIIMATIQAIEARSVSRLAG